MLILNDLWGRLSSVFFFFSDSASRDLARSQGLPQVEPITEGGVNMHRDVHTGVTVETEDPLLAAAILAAFQTGSDVIVNEGPKGLSVDFIQPQTPAPPTPKSPQ